MGKTDGGGVVLDMLAAIGRDGWLRLVAVTLRQTVAVGGFMTMVIVGLLLGVFRNQLDQGVFKDFWLMKRMKVMTELGRLQS